MKSCEAMIMKSIQHSGQSHGRCKCGSEGFEKIHLRTVMAFIGVQRCDA